MNIVPLLHANANHLKLHKGLPQQYERLLGAVGNASVVLLGSQTHGSEEFYGHRMAITKHLIEKKGFTSVAMGVDWSNAHKIHRYVTGGTHEPLRHVMRSVDYYPTWLWQNSQMEGFVEFLREHNDRLKFVEHDKKQRTKVGFYGLDLYSMFGSIHAINDYLKKVDPKAAHAARRVYSCIGHKKGSVEAISHKFGDHRTEHELVRELKMLEHERRKLINKKGHIDEDAYFQAKINAETILDADHYYSALSASDPTKAWNIREVHMYKTLKELVEHLSEERGRPEKVVVWEHNSHVGDGSATEWSEKGEENLGQLVRQTFGIGNTFSVGFTTYEGQLLAAKAWGENPHVIPLKPAVPDSWADIMHKVGIPGFYFVTRSNSTEVKPDEALVDALSEPRLERAIGTVYVPEAEGDAHYFNAKLGLQFDAVIHIDKTSPIQLLPEPKPVDFEKVEPQALFGV